MPNIPDILRKQVNPDFWEKMKNRMIVGFYRYGDPGQRNKDHGAMHVLRKKLNAYTKTGNTELLLDIANCAMIEFTNPEHDNAHFRTEDQGSDFVLKSKTMLFR